MDITFELYKRNDKWRSTVNVGPYSSSASVGAEKEGPDIEAVRKSVKKITNRPLLMSALPAPVRITLVLIDKFLDAIADKDEEATGLARKQRLKCIKGIDRLLRRKGTRCPSVSGCN